MTKNNILLSVLSGLLLATSWFFKPFALLILVAIVPLLLVENSVEGLKDSQKKMTLYASITFLIWNSLTIWWIYKATLFGAIFAVIGNSFLMLFTFCLYFWLRRKSNFRISNYTLIIWWLAFEFAYLRTEISFPWLHLGNTFSTTPSLVQWYEYTGTLGGTLLVLFVNISLSRIIIAFKKSKNNKHTIYQTIATLFIPAFLFTYSWFVYSNYEEKGEAVEVVVVQPNIDPYKEKFDGLSDREQLDRILDLAAKKITPDTRMVVAPETAITENVWENNIENAMSSLVISNFLSNWQNLSVLIGASTRKIYENGETPSPTAIAFRDTAIFYDRYNTALMYDSAEIQIYHKSRLVIGVEKMPYPKYLKFLESISIDLGGTVGSLGTQETPSVFKFGNIMSAPVICYESVYGEYVTEYVHEGANMLSIITNDGWWGNTPGYKQHLSFASLRAIETRRTIARSANTGISCFVNQRGEILQPTEWWTPDVISDKVHLNTETTFYTKYGDWLGRAAGIFSLLLLAYGITLVLQSRRVSLKKRHSQETDN